MRWYDHPAARRFALARWSFRRKNWHPQAKRLARLRSLYWVLVRGHYCEICGVCGGPVRLVFHVPDALWERFCGFTGSRRSPGGEAAYGVLCPACFDDLHKASSGRGEYLRWTCSSDDEVMVG